MRKAVLNPNILPAAKQEFYVEGFSYSNRIIQRDSITIELGQIERPDKTIVPAGRVEPGDFSITIDAADNFSREEYYLWFLKARDGFAYQNFETVRNDRVYGPDVYNYNFGSYPSNPFNISGETNRPGIAGDYKRKAVITYHRLISPNDPINQTLASIYGNNLPVRIVLYGCWCKSIEFSEFDMESDDAATLTLTISYDDAEMILGNTTNR